MSTDGYINVLCLDGGGIKGLYSATILEHIEDVYKSPISSAFDLICGTSTGGLIALALASGHTAQSIAEFYHSKGALIFPYQNPKLRTWHKYKSLVFSSKYSASVLESELRNFFGEGLYMNDLTTNVCIPSYNINTGAPVVFKKSSNTDFYIDKDVTVVDVALATSAAPTYFPVHEIKGTKHRDGQYIDGGIWANDPSLCGLLEIVRGTDSTNKPLVRIVSISAIPGSPAMPKLKKRNLSAIHWGSSIFDITIHAQLTQNPKIMDWISGHLEIEYHRIDQPNLNPAQRKLIEMDLATSPSLDLYKTLGQDSGIKFVNNQRPLLHRLFNNQKP